MPDNSANNKRIAKNTLLLYFRMLFLMCVSLFTSRVILATLGITDYGVYNVIGGMVAMFSIISGAMSVAVSRYITIWVGKNDTKGLNVVFSTSVIIQATMALVICVVSEIVGIWFLENMMVIPSDRMYAAHWVLQCSIFTFIINLMSVPFNAVIIAHEKMSAFAYISIVEVLLKLAFVYALYISPFDKLIIFAIALTVLAVLMQLVYATYCHRYFSESHFTMVFDRTLLKDMFGFIGWAFFGNGVVVLKDQGTNVLLNIFCGPSVNAACGIAMKVNSSVYSFVNNFLVAVNPQITKNYSSGNYSEMHNLIIMASKFAFFIMLFLLMPLCANVDYILNLWLVEVPKHTSAFVVLVLFYSLVQCFYMPVLNGVLAQGDIKSYEIVLTILYLSNFISSYLLLKNGFAPEWTFVVNIIFDIFVIIKLLFQSKKKFDFPIKEFVVRSLARTLPILLVCLLFIYILPVSSANSFMSFIVDSVAIVLFTGLCILGYGVTPKERKRLVNYLRNKIHHV